MKKSKSEKLELKKVTLKNLDETTLDAIAGGNTLLTNYTCITNCIKDTCNKCG
ncbi:MAG: class I lanthipeptide [Candidatus Sulfotelmatobacter sp.]